MKLYFFSILFVIVFTGCTLKQSNNSSDSSNVLEQEEVKQFVDESFLIYKNTGNILGLFENAYIDDNGDTIYAHLIQKHSKGYTAKRYNENWTLELWYWENTKGELYDTSYWFVNEVHQIDEVDLTALDTIIGKVKFE